MNGEDAREERRVMGTRCALREVALCWRETDCPVRVLPSPDVSVSKVLGGGGGVGGGSEELGASLTHVRKSAHVCVKPRHKVKAPKCVSVCVFCLCAFVYVSACVCPCVVVSGCICVCVNVWACVSPPLS